MVQREDLFSDLVLFIFPQNFKDLNCYDANMQWFRHLNVTPKFLLSQTKEFNKLSNLALHFFFFCFFIGCFYFVHEHYNHILMELSQFFLSVKPYEAGNKKIVTKVGSHLPYSSMPLLRSCEGKGNLRFSHNIY